MLTKQHRFAMHITDLDKRSTYKTHMCGLCHALGDSYGLATRLLTSHEMILLNMLSSAQYREAPTVVTRRCPLNPLRKVSTNQGVASTFAAAASVELARVSAADDVQDSAGRDFVAQIAAQVVTRLLDQPHRTALRTLDSLGFDTEVLTQLGARQSAAEQDDSQDASQPSALASTELFASTARLADAPHNVEPLSIIGANYGVYLYLMDAFRDFPADMREGHYNPLRRFGAQAEGVYTLSIEGLTWLLARFEKIQAAIREQSGKLRLYRYQEIVRLLLNEPVDKIVFALWKQIQTEQGLAFTQLQAADVFKAAMFVLPTVSAAPASFKLIQTGAPDRAQGDWAGQFVAAHPAQIGVMQIEDSSDTVPDTAPDAESGADTPADTEQPKRKRKRSSGSGSNSGCDCNDPSDWSFLECIGLGCDSSSACRDCNSGGGDSNCDIGDGCGNCGGGDSSCDIGGCGDCNCSN